MKNPFDGRFKDLAEDHPELLLLLFGILEPGAKPRVVDVLRELQLDPVEIDHAYRIGDEFIAHFEAFTRWDPARACRCWRSTGSCCGTSSRCLCGAIWC